jgi:dCTP deaminase
MTLPYEHILEMTQGSDPAIRSSAQIDLKQIQPASLDCTLGDRAYRVVSSFLPRKDETIADLLKTRTLYDFSLGGDSVLEPHVPYIVPLRENMKLPAGVYGKSNPKSSIGRIDVFVRLLTDHTSQYDVIPEGYDGPLYLEIIPQSFLIRVHPGTAMNQIRFSRRPPAPLSVGDYRELQNRHGIIYNHEGIAIPADDLEARAGGVLLHSDLSLRDIIGYRAKLNAIEVIDLAKKDSYAPDGFFEPIERPKSGELVLEPKSFYLLATKERVAFPPDYAGEIDAYDPSSGEMRSHYAGFFDPGFGWGDDGSLHGTTAVLEVRAHDVPFRLTDGQIICTMKYEEMAAAPKALYGGGMGSTYTGQGPKLAKFFKNTW